MSALMTVRGLTKQYPARQGLFRARSWKRVVDSIDLEIEAGRTLALVGESGSGKTTVGLMLLGLLEPTAGEILYEGAPLSSRRGADRRALRRAMQVVFQDPYASLNARMTVSEALTEGMAVHGIGRTAHQRNERAADLLRSVGLPPGALPRYPHEFSGGQRQRIAIARALSVEPKFIVLDEPTSALDVSIQSQVLNLLRRLQADRGLTYLFITHNLGVVEYLADQVAVMEHGKIVERGTVDDIFDRTKEPYTKRLLESIPSLDPQRPRLMSAG